MMEVVGWVVVSYYDSSRCDKRVEVAAAEIERIDARRVEVFGLANE